MFWLIHNFERYWWKFDCIFFGGGGGDKQYNKDLPTTVTDCGDTIDTNFFLLNQGQDMTG